MQNENLQTVSDEISMKDIVVFFKLNLRLILLCGVAGLLFASAYLALAPKKFEARWLIQMASGSEEPAALIQRLRGPTVYPVEVQQICGILEDEEFGDYLGGKLKADAIKNVANAVEMKVSAPSPEQARKCAEVIIAMIVAQQSSLIDDRLVGRKEQLLQYQQSLQEEQQQLVRVKKVDLGNFGYLAKLDKLSWLRTRIDALQEESFLSQLHPAKLIAPIYVPSKPVSPKVGLMMLLGLTLGLMLGVLYALGREGWRRAA